MITKDLSCFLSEFLTIPVSDLGGLQRKIAFDLLDVIFCHRLKSLLCPRSIPFTVPWHKTAEHRLKPLELAGSLIDSDGIRLLVQNVDDPSMRDSCTETMRNTSGIYWIGIHLVLWLKNAGEWGPKKVEVIVF